MKEFELTDRIAVVTGAGRGIGREIAFALAEAGATIACADLDGPSAEASAQHLHTTFGGDHAAFTVDVRDATAVNALQAQVSEAFGRSDVLVNNAGIARNVAAEAMTDEDWHDVIDVNLNGVFYASRSFGAHMLERGRGAIVNIASMSGLIVNKPQPQAAYNAAKAGVIHLTKSMAAEWAARGVRVNAVSPGYIVTDMNRRALERYPDWGPEWITMTPSGRFGMPRDVALAVIYLASDAAAYVTGANLVVDGGYTAW
jgi:NAD(P)-dependent dehydrogenase (short-subunit alcohol dehydrogenase family)